MTEGAASGKVDQDRDDERNACNSKGEVVAICLVEAESLSVLHNFYSRCGRKECSNVNGHVEERESRVALSCHFGRGIELTDHHLQVSLEKASADADERKRTNDGTNGSTTVAERYSQKKVSKEHDADTDFHHFAVAKLVSENTANEWQEVHEHQES